MYQQNETLPSGTLFFLDKFFKCNPVELFKCSPVLF